MRTFECVIRRNKCDALRDADVYLDNCTANNSREIDWTCRKRCESQTWAMKGGRKEEKSCRMWQHGVKEVFRRQDASLCGKYVIDFLHSTCLFQPNCYST
jgi:hypothetical protein